MGTANHLPSFSLTGPQNTMMHSVPTGLFFVTLLSLGHCASSPRSGQAPKDAAAAVWIQVISLHRSDAPPTPTRGSTTEIHGSPGSWFTVGERQQSTSKHTWEEPELAKFFPNRTPEHHDAFSTHRTLLRDPAKPGPLRVIATIGPSPQRCRRCCLDSGDLFRSVRLTFGLCR